MMAKKTKAKILIVLGILGIVFVCTWDFFLGKAVTDITGPKSIVVLAVSVSMILLGFIALKSKK